MKPIVKTAKKIIIDQNPKAPKLPNEIAQGKRKNKFVNINRDENPFKKLLALNIK